MFLPTPNPVAFTVFGLNIYWYGIIITVGICIALLITYVRADTHKIPRSRIIDLALISLPIGIVGARLYYVIFNWESHAGDFAKIINIRLGGLAIHGGLIAGFAAAAFFCILWNIKPVNLLDLVVPSVALAQAIGRWGNYFNSEAHGGPTDLPWAIEVGGEMVHPTFLYESIWCLLLFIFLIFIDNRRKFIGQTFLLYGMLYSLERFFVESLRTDSLMIGPFMTAQVVSLGIIILFLILYIVLYRRSRYKNRLFY